MVFRTVIIGAGPAGLTAAHELAKQGLPNRLPAQLAAQAIQRTAPIQRTPPAPIPPTGLTTASVKKQVGLAHQAIVLEQADQVGGRSRYETYQGYTLDLGAHRFTTQIPEIQTLWQDLLAGDLISVAGLSRIIYRHRFFDYPLAFTNALKQIGPIDTTLGALSYLAAQLQSQLLPPLEMAASEETAKHWLVQRFGRHLYDMFFEPYLQKILGMPGTQVHSDWIETHLTTHLSGDALPKVMAASLSRKSGTASTVFAYPLLGPGMLWERCRTRIEMMGSKVHTRTKVVQIERTGDRIDRVIVQKTVQKTVQTQPNNRSAVNNNTLASTPPATREPALSVMALSVVEGDQFISSLPLADLIAQLDPPAPPLVRTAAQQLKYRSSIMVSLMMPVAELFPDTTLYIHDPKLQVSRIQNFKNWSAPMVPDRDKTCLGMEYFCTEGDDLWTLAESDLIRLASQELVDLGLVPDIGWVEAGAVIREAKSHALLTQDYYKPLAIVQDYLSNFENLQTVGNGGGHCDRPHDHSAFTGLLAARHLLDQPLQTLSVEKRMYV